MWICPRCQNTCEGDYCPKCGQKHITEYGKEYVTYTESSIAYLMNSIKSLKRLCIILLLVIIVLLILFAFAYFSVWENIKDLWRNTDDLWENAEDLWENAELLWDYFW